MQCNISGGKELTLIDFLNYLDYNKLMESIRSKRIHVDPATYVPAAQDARDLRQRDGESYPKWQKRLVGIGKEMRTKYPGGQAVAREAVSRSGVQDPAETFKIPPLEQ